MWSYKYFLKGPNVGKYIEDLTTELFFFQLQFTHLYSSDWNMAHDFEIKGIKIHIYLYMTDGLKRCYCYLSLFSLRFFHILLDYLMKYWITSGIIFSMTSQFRILLIPHIWIQSGKNKKLLLYLFMRDFRRWIFSEIQWIILEKLQK